MSQRKQLLLICTEDDRQYYDRLMKLPVCRGWKISAVMRSSISTDADVQLMATRINAHAVLCCNVEALRLVLEAQYDYIPPNTRRGVTLDDYAGSLLVLHAIPNVCPERELVVLNPLHHLVTTTTGPFLFERYISKVTEPEKWYPQTEFQWEIVDPLTDQQRAEEVYELFRTADIISDDIETAIGDAQRRITLAGFTAYFRRTHTTLSIVIPFTSPEAWTYVRRIGEIPVRKVFQGGLYDTVYKARWNCLPSHWFWDTLHLFHSWYSELPKRLDFVTAFSVRRIRYWKDDGKSGNFTDYCRYNALDHWATLNSLLALVHEMPAWAIRNYVEEFPLVFPSLLCALEGCKFDMERLNEVRTKKQSELDKELARLAYVFGTKEFNPSSPTQVAQVFKILGIKGLTSTDKIAMQKAQATSAFNSMVLQRIVDYRKQRKIVGTYLVPEKFWNERLYYRLDPAGTDTFRMASTESSFWCGLQIQNIPRDDDSVKQCVLADTGWLLCEIDKAQSEARCVAYLSGELPLIELVEDPNREYHSWNASKFFGIPYEDLWDRVAKKSKNKEIRNLSKRTNHGANYNMGPDVLLDTMGPKNVARAKVLLQSPRHWSLRKVCEFLLAQFDKTYPNIRGRYYQFLLKRWLLAKGLVESPLGWTRKFFGRPDNNKRNLNSLVAHEPQNLSVHIINREFYKVFLAQLYGELNGIYRLKAQIHDSIFGQYRQDRSDIPNLVATKYMATAVSITDPIGITRTMQIPVDVSAGKNRWSELK
jgi:hypothetical protein